MWSVSIDFHLKQAGLSALTGRRGRQFSCKKPGQDFFVLFAAKDFLEGDVCFDVDEAHGEFLLGEKKRKPGS